MSLEFNHFHAGQHRPFSPASHRFVDLRQGVVRHLPPSLQCRTDVRIPSIDSHTRAIKWGTEAGTPGAPIDGAPLPTSGGRPSAAASPDPISRTRKGVTT